MCPWDGTYSTAVKLDTDSFWVVFGIGRDCSSGEHHVSPHRLLQPGEWLFCCSRDPDRSVCADTDDLLGRRIRLWLCINPGAPGCAPTKGFVGISCLFEVALADASYMIPLLV